jgi:hypothetical protein
LKSACPTHAEETAKPAACRIIIVPTHANKTVMRQGVIGTGSRRAQDKIGWPPFAGNGDQCNHEAEFVNEEAAAAASLVDPTLVKLRKMLVDLKGAGMSNVPYVINLASFAVSPDDRGSRSGHR